MSAYEEPYETAILCQVRLLSTAEGGRETPIKLGGFTNVFVGENAGSAVFGHKSEKEVFIDPGAELEVTIFLAQRSTHEGYLREGETIELAEGGRRIGKGRILKVINGVSVEDIRR